MSLVQSLLLLMLLIPAATSGCWWEQRGTNQVPRLQSECGGTWQGPLSWASPGQLTSSSIQVLAQLLHGSQGEAPHGC